MRCIEGGPSAVRIETQVIGPFPPRSKRSGPPPAWWGRAQDRLARQVRRRPWLAGVTVAGLHALLFLLLLAPPAPTPWTPPVVMDVEMVDGRPGGGGSPRGAERALETPSAGDEGRAETPPAAEPTPPPEPTRTTPTPDAAAPAEEEPTPEAPEPPTQDPDVVAMVEALTGVKAEAIERRDTVSIDAALAATLASAAGPTDGAGGCDLTGEMRRVLQADEEVLAALDRIPHGSRSVANAFLLWDGEWVDGRDQGAAPALAEIRASVVDVVRRAPAECRAAASDGPRFIVLEGGTASHVLVLGSGPWKWADLGPPTEPQRRRSWWPFP